MKASKVFSITVAVIVALTVFDASARGGHGGGGHGFHSGGAHGGGGHGGSRGGFGHHHGRFGLGFVLGSSLFWPSYYYWPYYSYNPYTYVPPVAPPAVPPVYIEQGAGTQLEPLGTDYWDYCPDPEGYYPHVNQCAAGWQNVDTQPAGQPAGYWYYCNNPAGYYPYIRTCDVSWQKLVP